MKLGADFNNFTVLTQFEADMLRYTLDFAIVGLESLDIAKANVAKLGSMPIQWYLNRPGLSLVLCKPGDTVWIDVEKDCFVTAEAVRAQGTLNTSRGLRTGIYTNQEGMRVPFGNSTELAAFGLPLWYANYRPPNWDTFVPFNGWSSPVMWQYGDGPYCGINVDLSVARDDPAPQPVFIDGVGLHFSDNTERQVYP